MFLGQATMVKESLPRWFQGGAQEVLVHINVGGLKRSLCSNTLKKFPDTRLGKLLACDSEEDILQVGLSAGSLGSSALFSSPSCCSGLDIKTDFESTL